MGTASQVNPDRTMRTFCGRSIRAIGTLLVPYSPAVTMQTRRTYPIKTRKHNYTKQKPNRIIINHFWSHLYYIYTTILAVYTISDMFNAQPQNHTHSRTDDTQHTHTHKRRQRRIAVSSSVSCVLFVFIFHVIRFNASPYKNSFADVRFHFDHELIRYHRTRTADGWWPAKPIRRCRSGCTSIRTVRRQANSGCRRWSRSIS